MKLPIEEANATLVIYRHNSYGDGSEWSRWICKRYESRGSAMAALTRMRNSTRKRPNVSYEACWIEERNLAQQLNPVYVTKGEFRDTFSEVADPVVDEATEPAPV